MSLQELRRRIYHKAKSEATHRFWGLFVHVTKLETLHEAYHVAKRNGGAAGIDGQTFEAIEQAGRWRFLAVLQQELRSGSYQPQANRLVDMPKGHGNSRTLQIPGMRDRVVPGALKLILEAVFEADCCENSYGERPGRSPGQALAQVRRSVLRRMFLVIDVDLSSSFDTIRHSVLLEHIAKRVQDSQVLHLIKQIIKVGGNIGVPQGRPLSPLAAHLYLNEVDRAFDAIRRKPAEGNAAAVNYHRVADDYRDCGKRPSQEARVGSTRLTTPPGGPRLTWGEAKPGDNTDGRHPPKGAPLALRGVLCAGSAGVKAQAISS
jgi:group II intron reverse transcriptase/maturase